MEKHHLELQSTVDRRMVETRRQASDMAPGFELSGIGVVLNPQLFVQTTSNSYPARLL